MGLRFEKQTDSSISIRDLLITATILVSVHCDRFLARHFYDQNHRAATPRNKSQLASLAAKKLS